MNDLWKERVRQYRESGISAARWCREQGVSVSALRYYLYKQKSKAASKFIELKPERSGLQLHCKNIAFELAPDFDEVTLTRFLAVLVKSC